MSQRAHAVTDWYLPLNRPVQEGWLYGLPPVSGGYLNSGGVDIPSDLAEIAVALRDSARDKDARIQEMGQSANLSRGFSLFESDLDGRVEKPKTLDPGAPPVEPWAFRVTPLPSVRTGWTYHLRRIRALHRSLADLRIPEPVIQKLKTPRNGLILICGGTGSGKTTTASAFVAERLKEGVNSSLTIEDPIEHLLDGTYPSARGTGRCIQLDTLLLGGHTRAVQYALRGCPTGQVPLLFIGEVLNSEVANELLMAANTGFLVICTIHGKSPIDALRRLISYAAAKADTPVAQVYDLLGSAFRLAVHQTLEGSANTPSGQVGMGQRLRVQVLEATDTVAAKIRTGSIEQLKNDEMEQNNTLARQVRQRNQTP